MSTTVTYKGNTLATVDNDTVTLETAGKYCEDDFTLTDVSGGAEMITVTIHDDFGSIAFKFIDPNATIEQIVDYDMGTVYWELTTPKQSLFVIYSRFGTLSATTTTGTYDHYYQTGRNEYSLFGFYLGDTNGIITLSV